VLVSRSRTDTRMRTFRGKSAATNMTVASARANDNYMCYVYECAYVYICIYYMGVYVCIYIFINIDIYIYINIYIYI